MVNIPEYILEILQANPNIGRYKLSEMANISDSLARYYVKLWKEQRDYGENGKVLHGVALGDIHYPDHDRPSISIALQFCRDFQPDIFILAGDQMDMSSISEYNKNKPKLLEGRRLKKEYTGFQEDILDKFDNVLGDRCRKYFFIGNHEYRTHWLVESDPQYEGWVEPENNLNLEEYKIIGFNDTLNIGEAYFAHGVYYNKYFAEKNVRVFGKHIFTWHTHVPQVFTMISPVNHLPKQGVGIGCLCNKNPGYKKGRPNAWVHQFLYFYLYGDGQFTYYTPIVLNGRTIINNKKYVG